MAKTLSAGPFRLTGSYSYSKTTTLGGPVANSDSYSYSVTYTHGTGAGAAQYIYADLLSIAASGTTSLDLNAVAGTPLTDVFGDDITFAKVKLIYINLTTTTAAASITVGGNANGLINWVGAANDKIRIRNDGAFFLACKDATGYAVTAATGDILDITNESSTLAASVIVYIVGE